MIFLVTEDDICFSFYI